jgi:hypothetical protein
LYCVDTETNEYFRKFAATQAAEPVAREKYNEKYKKVAETLGDYDTSRGSS